MESTHENNILVIGNGFDLYHKLKTKYIQYVNFTKSGNFNNNPFIKSFQEVADANDEWIDCEDVIKRIVDLFEKVLSKIDMKRNLSFSLSGLSAEENKFVKVFDRYFEKNNTTLGSMHIANKFQNGFGELDKKKFFRELKKDLDETICSLETYLSQCMNDIDHNLHSEQIASLEPSYVVNFNYTDTICELYGVTEENVFYIHGKLKSSPNNMVFGIHDDNEENLDFVYFKKYFQRIQRRTGLLDKEKFTTRSIFSDKRVTYNKVSVSHFFGHSLSVTDGDVIREIRELSKKMIIYYRDQEDYEIKVINLIAVFGKEDAVEMIQTGFIEFVEIAPKDLSCNKCNA